MIQVCGSRAASRSAPGSLRAAGRLSMPARRAERGQHDQRQVDRRHQPGVRGAGGGQHRQADQLHRGDAEVAAAGVEPERPALEPLRVEQVDVRHRGGEVAAADAGQAGQHHQRGVGDARARAATAIGTAGTSSSSALTIVQLRPPKRATASVYGSRSTAPSSGRHGGEQELPGRVDAVRRAEEEHQ